MTSDWFFDWLLVGYLISTIVVNSLSFNRLIVAGLLIVVPLYFSHSHRGCIERRDGAEVLDSAPFADL